MGKRGTKPLPTHELKLRGSWRAKARLKAGEPQLDPIKEPPPPPDYLGDRGRAEWLKIAGTLVRKGMLAEEETTALGHLCKALDDYWQADADIQENGLKVRGSLGGEVANPSLVERHKAWTRYVKMLTEFGLTGSSRSGIRALEKPVSKVMTRQRA